MPPMLQAEHRGHSAIPSVAAGMGLLSVTGLALLILILRVGMTLLLMLVAPISAQRWHIRAECAAVPL